MKQRIHKEHFAMTHEDYEHQQYLIDIVKKHGYGSPEADKAVEKLRILYERESLKREVEYAKAISACKVRALKLMKQYCAKNQKIVNEYIVDNFNKGNEGIPNNASITQIMPVKIDMGFITFMITLTVNEEESYMSEFVVSIGELELYNRLKKYEQIGTHNNKDYNSCL